MVKPSASKEINGIKIEVPTGSSWAFVTDKLGDSVSFSREGLADLKRLILWAEAQIDWRERK